MLLATKKLHDFILLGMLPLAILPVTCVATKLQENLLSIMESSHTLLGAAAVLAELLQHRPQA